MYCFFFSIWYPQFFLQNTWMLAISTTTTTLSNNKWTGIHHHNDVLMPDIAPHNAGNVEQLFSAEICFSPYLHLCFFPSPFGASVMEHIPCWACWVRPSLPPSKKCVFSCNSKSQFKFWCFTWHSLKMTDVGLTLWHAVVIVLHGFLCYAYHCLFQAWLVVIRSHRLPSS